MIVEIKPIALDVNSVYRSISYPDSGMFLIEGTNEIIFVNKVTDLCFLMCYKHEIKAIESTIKNGSVSEGFVLELTKVLTREKD